MAHELERFFEDLAQAVFHIACEVLLDILVQADDADRLGDVDDVLLIPDRHGRDIWQRVAAGEEELLAGSEVELSQSRLM